MELMKKLQLFTLLAAAVLLASCGGKPEKTIADEVALPWFGKVLSTYRDMYLAGNNSRKIGRDIRGIINEVRQETVPVIGTPYGIRCSKAVIDDYNVQSDCINIIMEFVPDEGTDFNLSGFKGNIISIDYGPYGKSVQAQAFGGEQFIFARTCHCSDGKMLVTLIVKYEDLQQWKKLDHIKLVEKKD